MHAVGGDPLVDRRDGRRLAVRLVLDPSYVFVLLHATALGVRAHHWSFGNMPAVEGLTRADVKMIVAYIRELQRANGIN